MSPISDIVTVNITRETQAVTQRGFGVPLILGTHTRFPVGEVRAYSNIEGVAEDFETSDAEYLKAVALFGQEIKPEQIKIGSRAAAVAQVNNIDVTTVVDNTDYSTFINGTEFTFNSGVAATAATIVDGLVAAIIAGTEPVTPTDNGDDFDLTADIPGESFSLTVTTNLTATSTTPNSGLASDILDAVQTDNDWYFLHITTSLELDILEGAKTIESLIKLFFYKTSDVDVKNGVADNIAEVLFSKNYDRTVQCFISDAPSEMDGAWVGGQAPKNPGSITWKFKTLSGVTTDTLTQTQQNNLRDVNSNFYIEIGGVSITQEGVVASGEFIDIMRGTDWIQARIEENVYSALVNEDKIPFTNDGIDVIKSKIMQILLSAVNRGILVNTPDQPLKVSAPDILLVPFNDRANRLLEGVTFEGFYAGAIHKVKIQGYLSV